MAESSGVLGQNDQLAHRLALRALLCARETVHHPGARLSRCGGQGSSRWHRSRLYTGIKQGGLAVRAASGFEETAGTPRGWGTAAPLALVFRPLLLRSCGRIASTLLLAGSQGQVLATSFLERCPQTVLECRFLLLG